MWFPCASHSRAGGVALLAAAFVLDRWELVAFQAAALLLTALSLRLGPYVLLYRAVLRPAGLVKADVRVDNLAPHRFAALFGTAVAGSAAYLVASGKGTLGWGLVWLLISLASLNFAGWCAGCFTYYWLHRSGLRSLFPQAPIAGTFPGARPPRRA